MSITTQQPTTPSTPAGAHGPCVVSYALSDWGACFNACVTVYNRSSTAIDGWTVTFCFPGNQVINILWNGVHSQSGNEVTVRADPRNAVIPAGGSASFGFNGSSGAGNGIPETFTVNGDSCAEAGRLLASLGRPGTYSLGKEHR